MVEHYLLKGILHCVNKELDGKDDLGDLTIVEAS